MKTLLEKFCVWYLRKRWGGMQISIPRQPLNNIPNFLRPEQPVKPIKEAK